jgi:MoaA/NifB/PqqE/SkfB family radical SAM enzyme
MRQLPIVDINQRKSSEKAVPIWEKSRPRSIRHQQMEAAQAALRGAKIEVTKMNVFILNYTMKCPLACDYCCYSCGPRRVETMDLDLALGLVDQAARLQVFSECGFTGGEPLIFFDDIMKIAERMSGHGLRFSMISACDWAVNAAAVERYITPLVDRGMSVFTVSYDPSHERWVPRDNVRRVVSRLLDLGVHAVICGSFYDDTSRLEEIFPEFRGTSVDFVNRVVLPKIGRTKNKKLAPDSYPNTRIQASGTCYKRIYHDVTVFWDGEVYPCCSVYNRDTPGISYGNVYDLPLGEIWDRIEGSLFLRMIKRGGFSELYEFIQERDPELALTLPDPATAVGPCHLCHLIMGDGETSRAIHQVFAEEERERIVRILSGVARQSGLQTAQQVVEGAFTSGR